MKTKLALRANAPLFILGTLLAVSLLTRCSGSSQTTPAGPDASGGQSSSAGAGGMPALSCTPATVAQDCPLPGSTCDGNTLVYYSNPACSNGVCAWDHTGMLCYGPCSNGACTASTTTTAPPPPDSGNSGGSSGDSGSGGVASYATCNGGAGGEAGATPTCELPTSVCADDVTLLYFSNPRCVQGTCEADVNALACGISGCQNGGCLPSPTVPR